MNSLVRILVVATVCMMGLAATAWGATELDKKLPKEN